MKIEYNFELDELFLKRRQLEFDNIIHNPFIVKFINKYKVNENVILENVYKFKNWIKEQMRIESLTYEEVYENPSLGEYIDLVYDSKLGILEEVVVKAPILLEIENKRSFLEQYKIQKLPQSFEKASFECLSNTIKNESKNYQLLLLSLRDFVDNDVLGYYIYGDLGVGKSFLAACVTNEFAKQKKSVAFIHIPTYINQLKGSFGNASEMEYMINTMKYVPILVLDDLGAETITSWSRDEILLSILNERMENKRKTIITSNHPHTNLLNLYTTDSRGLNDEIRAKRLVERINALCIPYHLEGESRRNLNFKLNNK